MQILQSSGYGQRNLPDSYDSWPSQAATERRGTSDINRSKRTASENNSDFREAGVPSSYGKDSGYKSLETELVTHKIEGNQQYIDGTHQGNEILETRTVYSKAESLLYHPDIDNYITAFATELANSIPLELWGSNLEKISSALPSLLKAFAIKFGQENSENLSRQLMYLVYRFCSEITRRFQRMIHVAGDGNEFDAWTGGIEKGRDEGNASMDLDDIMNLWDSKENVSGDDDYDEKDIPNLASYREVLTKASSYKWLLSSIRAQGTLYVPGPDTATSHVGNRIIEAAGRPGKLSRKETHELQMQFTVAWNPFLFMREQYYTHLPAEVLAHAITLTGHDNNIQAATCENYVQQTWPATGSYLLELLRKTIQCEVGNCDGVLPDKTRLCARFLDHELLLTAIGNPFSVAEVAEQLAWMGAALRSSPHSTEAAYSCGYIAQLNITSVKGAPNNLHGHCRIEFSTEILVDDNLARNGKCWRGMFRNPVIATGYPIPRRSEADTGLEIPLEMVAALTNCKRVMGFAGVTFLKGFAAMLAAVRVVGNLVFWHLCYNPKGEYISYEDNRVSRSFHSNHYPQGLTLDLLERGRHIVGWSNDVRNFAGAPDADYNIEWSDLPSPNSICVLEKVTITGSAAPFISSGASFALGIKDKPLHLGFGSGDDYMGNLITMGKRHFIFYDTEERRAWLIDGVSAVLHLLRAYLQFYLEDIRVGDYYIYKNGDIKEASSGVAYTGAKAAYEVLNNAHNQKLPLYPKNLEESEEKMVKLGVEHEGRETTTTNTNFTLKERVEQLCHVLLQITAYHDDLSAQAGYGWRIKKSPRHRIEGFEFMDVATKYDTLWPKVATIHAMSVGWVDFARALHAIPLFGVGFGELLRPVRTGLACCSPTTSVPLGKDFLAVYGADLEEILRKGSKRRRPWRLVENIHWHSPDGVAFESCKCTARAEGARGKITGDPGQPGMSQVASKQEKRGLKGLLGGLGCHNPTSHGRFREDQVEPKNDQSRKNYGRQRSCSDL
ncbi:hypothetical protein GGR54DRAFT_652332 [Hypoxylon sp. NC1633]|nr:hypothetical protein GGR54DRAFT_652332 [Hypoxylon sp. NC1633]